MNKQEAQKTVVAIMAAYPNHYKHFTTFEIETLVGVWESCCEDYTYEQVSAGLKIFLTSDTKGFPPSPGQVIDCILKITKPEALKMSEGEAWSIVRKAVEKGSYYAEEEFEKFPEPIKRAVGSPSNIRSMAMDDEFNEGVAKSLFERTYREMLNREREDAKIPQNVKQLIATTVMQLEQKGQKE